LHLLDIEHAWHTDEARRQALRARHLVPEFLWAYNYREVRVLPTTGQTSTVERTPPLVGLCIVILALVQVALAAG
jgi:hypothetical protein